MASPVRTRHKSASPMSEYLGRGKEMSPTELPTSRDILRYCLLRRETLPEFKTNQSIRVMMDKVLEEIRARWKRANFKFQPPVTATDRSILDRLSALWEKCSKISRNKSNAKEKNKFEEGLDRLFDITKCRCPLLACENELSKCTGYWVSM